MGRKAQVRFLGGWARATASGNPTRSENAMSNVFEHDRAGMRLKLADCR